jgi:electron transfer flavoprotein alpha subunit
MSELIRDQLELERQRDAFTRLDRTNAAERDIAVLKTRFEAFSETIIKELARSVSQEDLKEIRREILMTKHDFSAEIEREIQKMHDEFEKSNRAQAEMILSGARALNSEAQMQRMQESKQLMRQVGLTIFAAALSIICTMVVFWMTTARP